MNVLTVIWRKKSSIATSDDWKNLMIEKSDDRSNWWLKHLMLDKYHLMVGKKNLMIEKHLKKYLIIIRSNDWSIWWLISKSDDWSIWLLKHLTIEASDGWSIWLLLPWLLKPNRSWALWHTNSVTLSQSTTLSMKF